MTRCRVIFHVSSDLCEIITVINEVGRVDPVSGSLDLMIVIIMIMMIVMIMMTMSGSLDLARMILTMKIIRVMTRLVIDTSLTNSGPPDDILTERHSNVDDLALLVVQHRLHGPVRHPLPRIPGGCCRTVQPWEHC